MAARMRVYESGLCIVGAHLSAGESEEDSSKRNSDYAEIVRRGQFPPEALALDPETLGPSSNPQSPGISKASRFCPLLACLLCSAYPPAHTVSLYSPCPSNFSLHVPV